MEKLLQLFRPSRRHCYQDFLLSILLTINLNSSLPHAHNRNRNCKISMDMFQLSDNSQILPPRTVTTACFSMSVPPPWSTSSLWHLQFGPRQMSKNSIALGSRVSHFGWSDRLDSWSVHNFDKLWHWNLVPWMSRKRVPYSLHWNYKSGKNDIWS